MKRACPACHGPEANVLASIAASAIVRVNATYRSDALAVLQVPDTARYALVACSRCGFVFAQDLPDDEFLARLYRDVIDSVAERESSVGVMWKAHQLRLASSLVSRAAAIGPVRILDYGCGDGTVVKALTAAGISCTGFELYARGTNADGIVDSLAALTTASFTGVLLSDVLEHVPAPRRVLEECRELLSSGGWLAINVPDFNEARLRAIVRDLEAGRPVTREINPWEHLNYFSPASLARMLHQAGFRVETTPVADFGFRAETTGIRRVTNAVKSAGRLVKHAIAPRSGSTTIFAQKI